MKYSSRVASSLSTIAMVFTLLTPQLGLAGPAPAGGAPPATSGATATVLPLDELKKALEPGSVGPGAGKAFPTADPFKIANGVILVFFSIMGLVFTALMIYGGWNWMTAMGEEEKVTKAKDTIVAALIGIIILIAAYAITTFVINNIYSRAAGVATTP